MNPFKEYCPLQAKLVMAWHTAVKAYSKAVFDCSCQIDNVSLGEYARLKAVAEDAGRRSVEAQAKLDAHIREHGCDGKREVAA